MPSDSPTTYITTPIYYVNDRPHIGHCYTTLLADVTARFYRLHKGEDAIGSVNPRDVFFLTGTDEHADKVVTSAASHNVSPIQWADQNAAEFKKAFAFMNCSNDDFIRTTEDRHKSKVLEYIRELQKKGDIYLGDYVGWFDESQEEYLTETAAKEANYVSPVTGKALIKKIEKNYFFKLSAYQDKLRAHFDANPAFVLPEARRNEVLGRLRDGLQDIPISRAVTADPTSQWGIKMPDDPSHRIYVWIDALFNYLSVVDTPERVRFWPATVHYIAKDILWFHAVIWPALLMALGRDLPRAVYSHAYWVRDGRKMSKSLGNFVTIEVLHAYAQKYSLDALRWYLVTQGPQGATDADFSHAKFVEVYNADLANGIGNCASRVGNMIEKYFGGTLPEFQSTWIDRRWETTSADAVPRYLEAAKSLDLAAAFEAASSLIKDVDDLISETKPFTLAKDMSANGQEVANILACCAESIRIASVLLSPAMPQKMSQLWQAWNCAPPQSTPLPEICGFNGPCGLKAGHRIAKGDALFMRADPAEAPPA
ncbi:MAG: methionine--tRNA ligase [Phycisphaeraceae bacterium]|nr:methionine--tRNA ligase [Phycisphaeraceae bacterium]